MKQEPASLHAKASVSAGSRDRPRTWQWKQALLGAGFITLWLFVAFTAAYWIHFPLLYALHWQLSGYWELMLMVAIATALVLAAAVVWNLLGLDHDDSVFFDVLDSLQEIGQGNFSVRTRLVVKRGTPNHPINQLVISVREMAEGLEQIERMRQEFVGNVSHEMQTPLTSIMGFVKALKAGGVSEAEGRHYLDIIEAESDRLSRLAENLLKLSSLESGHHPVVMETFRLDRQLRDVVIACEPLWLEKQLEVDVDLVPAEVKADKDLLGQVWMNLLSNAVKFTDPGGRIHVALAADEEGVRVSISDTGIGIAEEDLPRVFERFFKADKSRGARPGNGLGLAIVKRIVEMHGGSVHVSSQLGKGSVFTVWLPSQRGDRMWYT